MTGSELVVVENASLIEASRHPDDGAREHPYDDEEVTVGGVSPSLHFAGFRHTDHCIGKKQAIEQDTYVQHIMCVVVV